jgi:outer membrane receptor for ferrienterochelin and colicins
VIRNSSLRLGLHPRPLTFVATWAMLAALASSSAAQPKIPDVKLPEAKVPDVKVPDVKAPDVKAPDVKLPEVKGPDGKPADGKPADGKPEEKKPPAPAVDDQSDAEVILFDDPKKAPKKNVVPSTLPKELKGNVKKGANVGFRDNAQGPVTIEEIVNSPVVTASKRKESASEAPAWVLVITANDIRERGYTDLDQILDDLPGMDVVRPGGEYYLRNYVRGYRSITAEPYLVLRDGVVVNHLFFRHGEIMATFPLTDIDHIEVAYGPASAVYGANAAMGLINIITRSGKAAQDEGRNGVGIRTRLIFGGPQGNLSSIGDPTKIVDATALYTSRGWRFRLSGRFEDGVVDKSIGDRSSFRYSQASMYSNPNIWGQSVLDAFPTMAGDFHSVDRKAAVDARLFLGEGTEVAAQMFVLTTGFGMTHPADRQQISGQITEQEVSVYGKHVAELSPRVGSTTLVQFRHSSVTSPTTYMSRETYDTGPEAAIYSLESPHYGVLVTQDFDIAAPANLLFSQDQLSLGVGLRFQHVENNLGSGRGYNELEASYFPINPTDPNLEPTSLGRDLDVPTLGVDDLGAYLTAKYQVFNAHALHAGVRLEHGSLRNSTDVIFRGGYVGKFVLHESASARSRDIQQTTLTAKILYGQAVYEPNIYELTRIRASDANEEDEIDAVHEPSHTIEANVDLLVRKFLSVHADAYYFQSKNPLVDTPILLDDSDPEGFVHLGTRRLAGLDVGARFFYRPVQLWAYYSHMLLAEDDCAGGAYPADFQCPGKVFVGDVSRHKLWGGITFDNGPFTATVMGRFMSARETVFTNPIREVPAYGTIDANISLNNVPWEGFSFGFRVTNIVGTQYSHPGIRTADSGNAPASISASGAYSGSAGNFNSLMLQPGRAFYLTVGLDLEPAETTTSK